MWAQWPLQLRDASALVTAKSQIGFALAPPGTERLSGFQLSIGEGRSLIRDYSKDCFRQASR